MTKKYIVLTGGVLSGLGKGVTAASIGFFFSQNYKTVPIKLDGYLNSDPGTMNPIEHGEVFVLEDGFEVDMDFGHYERFLSTNATRDQSITMGKIFKKVQQKERKGDYLGKTVQLIPHVTNLIQEEIQKTSKKTDADLVIIEVGGTIGDIENELFIEALRQLQRKVGEQNITFVHMSYVPIPYGVKEQKTKPTQQSISLLQKKGVWPNFIVARCQEYLTQNSKRKIALFGNIQEKNIFTAPDIDCIYKLPQIFYEQGLITQIAQKLALEVKKTTKLRKWNNLIKSKKHNSINLVIAGKYTDLEDSYASIVESLIHCEFNLDAKIKINWLETSKKIDEKILKKADAIIVPGGFGDRGIEGKISAIKYARENKIPYLGICYGLQLAVIEYARTICGLKDASSLEINPNSKNLVVTLLDEQKNVVDKGGTMRLGSYESLVSKGIISDYYKKIGACKITKEGVQIFERHRHRYEVNPNYIDLLQKKGMIFSGYSAKGLVEFIELDKKDHPYFVATQAHPELKSRLEKPAPLFYGLIDAAIKNKNR